MSGLDKLRNISSEPAITPTVLSEDVIAQTVTTRNLVVEESVTFPDGSVYSQEQSDNRYFSNSVPSSNRNAIINGGFDIWQRGTSFTSPTGGTYTADRWRGGGSGASAGTFTFARFSLSTIELPLTEAGLTFYAKHRQTVAPSAVHNIETRIENVRTFAGKTVTLSFYARLNSGTFALKFEIVPALGAGGAGSPVTITPTIKDSSGTTVTAANSFWKRYSATFTVPSISGLTIGTDNYLSMSLITPASGVWDFDITGIQLEQGTVATPFERRFIGEELALCQRYYQNIVVPTGTTDFNWPIVRESTTQAQVTIFLPVTLRASPSLVGSNFGRIVCRDTSFTVGAAAVSSISLNTSGGPSLNAVTLILGHGAIAGTFVYAEWDTLNTTTNYALSAEL
jgi:hypothetical protein